MVLVKLLDYFVYLLEEFFQGLFVFKIYLLFLFLEEIVERNDVHWLRFVLDLLEDLSGATFAKPN